MAAPAFAESRIELRAADGYPLGAKLFRPAAEPAHAVVVHAGVAIAAALYTRFARYLASAGVGVLLFDYRGIGRSRPAALRGFRASLEDWSEFDAAAAIDRVRAEFPAAEAVGFAHSFAAMILACAPNAPSLSRLVLVAPHTGYFGDYRLRYRWPMAAFWHGVMPLVTRACGYFPARWIGLGGDIPARVAMQWASRRQPVMRLDTAGDAARGERLLAAAARLARPALVLTFADDAFAPRAGADRFLAYTPGLAVTHRIVRPADVGLDRIGHFGFFRASAENKLWPPVLAYLLHEPPGGPAT